jgi:spermidine dehydrogenase
MRPRDRNLGMDRTISRRDLLHGMGALAAAHFFLKEKPKARILIVDNNDDFGGHARRNEFQVGGRTLIGYGGNQTLEAPSGYPDVVKGLLRDLGVDIKRFDTAYDQGFYKQNGLGPGIYFNQENWGVDRIVPSDMGSTSRANVLFL